MIEDSNSMGGVEAIGSGELASSLPGPGGVAAASAVAPVSGTPKRSQAPASPKQPGSPANSTPTVTAESLQAAAEQVNAHLATLNRVLSFRVDAQTGLTIATISNAQTGEVLQQTPSSDIVHLAQMLAAWSPGRNVLLDLIA